MVVNVGISICVFSCLQLHGDGYLSGGDRVIGQGFVVKQ